MFVCSWRAFYPDCQRRWRRFYGSYERTSERGRMIAEEAGGSMISKNSRRMQGQARPALGGKRKAARHSRRPLPNWYDDEGRTALELEAQAKLHDARVVS